MNFQDLMTKGNQPNADAKKGRLERRFDEFDEVHGTVLLGMHKELQTLKAEVDTRVETRIGAILQETRGAGSELSQRIEESKQLSESLRNQAEQQLETIQSTSRRANQQIKESAETAIDRVQQMTIETQARLSASLKIADQLNQESQSLLKSVQEQQLQLIEREQILQRRTRQWLVGIGVMIVATVGAWIWLTLKH